MGCIRYRTLGLMFLKPKDLKDMRTNCLIRLKANNRIGIIH